MKKINKLLLTIAPIGTLAIPTIALVSCGDKSSLAIATESKVNNVKIASSTSSIKLESANPINIKLTNERKTDVEDAKIVVFIKDQHVVFDVASIKSGENQITYTTQQLQSEFSAIGYTIANNDSITFKLIRVGQYNVVNNQLYQISFDGSEVLVTDNELKDTKLLNHFIYKDEYNDWHLNDEELTFPKWITSCTPSGVNEVCLLRNGEGEMYFTNSSNPTTGVSNIKVHGIVLNDGKTKVSNFRTYRDFPQVLSQPYGLGQESIRYTIDHVNMVGRSGYNNNDFVWDGMVCPYLNCTDCDFSGSYTASKTECHFKNCNFDSTNIIKGAEGTRNKTYNPMALYGGSTAEFENCTFLSIGKAVKIYWDIRSDTGTFNFKFTDCKFNLVDGERAGEQCNVCEYPIDVDTSLHSNELIFNLIINDGCEMNNAWKNKLKTMAEGQGLEFTDSLVHPNDNVDEDGNALHITINDKKIKAFSWPF